MIGGDDCMDAGDRVEPGAETERGRSRPSMDFTAPAHPCALGFVLFITKGSNSFPLDTKKPTLKSAFLCLAEREGFEPSIRG